MILESKTGMTLERKIEISLPFASEGRGDLNKEFERYDSVKRIDYAFDGSFAFFPDLCIVKSAESGNFTEVKLVRNRI